MSKRTIAILVLLGLVVFYTLGTGFAFFYRLLYVIGILGVVGMGWAWLNLRGLEVRLDRLATRGQVGGYLDGQLTVRNRNRLPKSWLEVTEVSDLPAYASGRGVGLVRDQQRTWRVETYLLRRGLFQTGQVRVTSQDPFGLFRLSRLFLESQPYIVLPSTEDLPDLDPRLANLPSDSRVNRRSDHITPDSSSVREYANGDSFRRIHWPYTAKMNALMVKEFDIGISAEAWVVVDMERSVHSSHYQDDVDNTEELSVTVAASLIRRLLEMSMPVGLAVDGDQQYVYRPDSSLIQLGRLMETLAVVRAEGNITLERFIYDLRPQLSRFNTVTLITASRRNEWVPALDALRRQGVNVSVVYIDGESFGVRPDVHAPVDSLAMNEIPTYVVKKGQSINEALRVPMYGNIPGQVGEASQGPQEAIG